MRHFVKIRLMEAIAYSSGLELDGRESIESGTKGSDVGSNLKTNRFYKDVRYYSHSFSVSYGLS